MTRPASPLPSLFPRQEMRSPQTARAASAAGKRRTWLLTAATITALSMAATPVVVAQQAATPIKFARFPHVANDGTIAFTYQDDIWLADANGQNPRRLTAHIARDFNPRFSPDGKLVAFTSNRMGNNDVFVVPAAGGEPRQLTWFTTSDQVVNWTPDGKGIIITTGRGAMQWGSPLYIVPIDGGQPTAMAMDMAGAGMIRQDGKMVAFNRILPTYWRKGYRGNNGGDISVQDVATGQITELTDTDQQQFRSFVNDVHPMWGSDGQIYYASERDGIFNIWRISPDGKTQTQVTKHTKGGVLFPAISADGKRIIYQNEFDLYTLDVPNGTPRKLDLRLAVDPKETDLTVLTASNNADGFTPSPTGDYIAVDFHGEIMIVPTESGVGEMTQVTNSPWRERSQLWSPDGKRIAYISDESGEEEIWMYDVEARQRRKVTNQQSLKSGLTWSPNSQKLAYSGDNHLWEVDAAGGAPRDLGHHPAGGYIIGQYTNDGNWITYTKRDDDQNADVYVFDIRNKRETNVSRAPLNDGNPTLTPDGKSVLFTSSRTGTNHLYIVSLSRLTEDPNDPLVRERQRRAAAATTTGRGGGSGGGGAGNNDAAGSTQQALQVQIDTTGIADRARALTSGTTGVSTYFLSRDGRTIYYTTGGGGGFGGGGRGQGAAAPAGDNPNTGLFAMNIDGTNSRRLAGGTFPGLTPTADGRTIFFRRAAGGAAAGGGRGGGAAQGGGGQGIAKLAIASPNRVDNVSFNFQVIVDNNAEREQIFEEAWRSMKYRFYDEKMHGRNWDAIKATYKPILQYVRTNEDVYDLANEMIGELNASHTGVSGPSSRQMPAVYRTRYLGFEMEPTNAGRYRISHIYRAGPADKEWLDLKVGDYVLSIDGTDLKSGDNYEQLLSTTLNEYIAVQVSAAANGSSPRTARIGSVASLNNIKYEEWVENNRDLVDRETKGDIAYVHIRAMDQPSLERFRAEIDRFSNKKGIIVDIRWNGGGNIDQELIDILERRPYQFWNQRTGSRVWGRRPRQAIPGPKVMLINQRSASDSEVTPMGFRQLGLGRIVGQPTYGAVIATGSYSLINGGSIRTPGSLVISYDPTKPNNYGINLENYGVPPDVWARNTPMDFLQGNDRELKAAITEVLRMLRENPGTYSGDN